MKQEPVAWEYEAEYPDSDMEGGNLHGLTFNQPSVWEYPDSEDLIWERPLYTAPKELSDEEIISSAEEAGFNWSEDKGIFVRHSNGSWIGLDSKMIDFARAILKKASEK